jgi:thiol-disulfide isomerase/thioredoxin
MKKNLLFLASLTILFLASCSKGDGDGGSGPVVTDDRPVVKLTKGSILADGFETTSISVVDKNNNDISSQCVVTINGNLVNSFEFYTTTVGSHTIKAKLVSKESLPVTLTATSPGTSKYSQKVLVEDYTGAWCGYCPRVAHSLTQAENSNPRIISVAIHNGDPMAHPQESQLRGRWGINAWPTAMVNRKYEWNEQVSVLSAETVKWSPLGLAIESSISGSTISGKVKAEFDVTTSLPMVMGIMLLENGIVYPQTSYYNGTVGSPFFGLGNPINNYVHNHTLRKFSTNIFGDDIPASAQVKGNIYEKTFTFNAAGYDLTKCTVLAFVGFADGLPNRAGALLISRLLFYVRGRR